MPAFYWYGNEKNLVICFETNRFHYSTTPWPDDTFLGILLWYIEDFTCTQAMNETFDPNLESILFCKFFVLSFIAFYRSYYQNPVTMLLQYCHNVKGQLAYIGVPHPRVNCPLINGPLIINGRTTLLWQYYCTDCVLTLWQGGPVFLFAISLKYYLQEIWLATKEDLNLFYPLRYCLCLEDIQKCRTSCYCHMLFNFCEIFVLEILHYWGSDHGFTIFFQPQFHF